MSTLNTDQRQIKPLDSFFPLPEIREKQAKALEFFRKAVSKGYRDVVIVSPTGTGKTGIGMSIAGWAADQDSLFLSDPGTVRRSGAYYLVTQKMLQDQIEADIPVFLQNTPAKLTKSIKASDNYECNLSGQDCRVTNMRGQWNCGEGCLYRVKKAEFLAAPIGVTNYAYFFSERTHVGQLTPRRILICDEAHNLENELMRIVEICLRREDLEEFTPHIAIKDVPDIKTVDEFMGWIGDFYVYEVKRIIDVEKAKGDLMNEEAQHLRELETFYNRLVSAVTSFRQKETAWVFWKSTEQDPKAPLSYNCRPLYVAPFFKKHIQRDEGVRVYMSAFLGSKEVFCKTLGLDPEKTAWCSLTSTFPAANRKVRLIPMGSMSYKFKQASLPNLLKSIVSILKVHPNEKGVIHCGSYDNGLKVYEFLKKAGYGARVLYPKNAEERDKAFEQHRKMDSPTVIISPSMTEGYDFKYDLARFQILMKVPFLHLKDKQVAERLRVEPQWYSLRAMMSVVQSVGRGCRAEDDQCVAYLLDSDFVSFFDRNAELIPNWFAESVHHG